MTKAAVEAAMQRAQKATPGPGLRLPDDNDWFDFVAAARTDLPALCRDWLEQDAEIERLKAALLRVRQGYRNILDFRKLSSEQWGQRDGYGGRYGALTREEIEGVIAEVESALSAASDSQPAVEAPHSYLCAASDSQPGNVCRHGVADDAPCVVCVPTGSNMRRMEPGTGEKANG